MHEQPEKVGSLFLVARMGYGALIREARKAKGFTQAELAERMQTSPSTISNLEREQHPPTVPEEVNDLCLALNISPESLLMAMGVRMSPAAATKLPPALIRDLASLTPAEMEAVLLQVRGLLALRRIEAELGGLAAQFLPSGTGSPDRAP